MAMIDSTVRAWVDQKEAPSGQCLTGPLNFGLNEGTYMPNACADLLRGLGDRLALRRYGSPDNAMLRAAIAKKDDVAPEHVFVREGSGPILRQVIPHLIRTAIKARPVRVLRHLLDKSGYPLVTTNFTYSKVPLGASKAGLTLAIVPLSPPTFRLDEQALAARLERRDSLVYLANPNNPTGNVLLSREAVARLALRFPKSLFWIDEAYVQYLEPRDHAPIAPIVPFHENVIVSRSFSFAYGLAAARVGYMVAPPKLVREMDAQLTPYRVGALPEALAIAALEDEEHLPWLRAVAARERRLLCDGLEALGGIETFASRVNFVLCRFEDGRDASPFARRLAARGYTIKVFDPVAGHTFAPYFRVTLGTFEENARLLAAVRAELDAHDRGMPAALA
jgi:histidinol-phosphate aminotransferase